MTGILPYTATLNKFLREVLTICYTQNKAAILSVGLILIIDDNTYSKYW